MSWALAVNETPGHYTCVGFGTLQAAQQSGHDDRAEHQPADDAEPKHDLGEPVLPGLGGPGRGDQAARNGLPVRR
jgi:hypothetical protein